MKYNLRNILPPSEEELQRFKQILDDPQTATPSECGFVRLMDAVTAQRHLDRYRKGSEQPATVGTLADILSRACSVSMAEMAAVASITSQTWQAIVEGAAKPYRIPVDAYVKIARRFELKFDVVKAAILGSYTALLKQSINGHMRFARSNSSSRKKEGYAKSLAISFEELRAKSKAYRESLPGNEEINGFIEELRKCLI